MKASFNWRAPGSSSDHLYNVLVETSFRFAALPIGRQSLPAAESKSYLCFPVESTRIATSHLARTHASGPVQQHSDS